MCEVTKPEQGPDASEMKEAPETRFPGASGPQSLLSHSRVVVVVPTYNEAENLPELARRLFALNLPDFKLIVVDDGSPDGTGTVAKKLTREFNGRVELVQRGTKMGLGPAYVEGFTRALEDGADYVVQMDADLSHAPESIPAFLEKLSSADVVVGSRYAPGGGVDEAWSISRRLLSAGGNLGIRSLAGLKVKDATAGFKAFRGSVLESMDLKQFRCKGFGFQAEVAHACQCKGYDIVEHPIIFESRFKGRSKMSVSIVAEAIWRLMFLRLRTRRKN